MRRIAILAAALSMLATPAFARCQYTCYWNDGQYQCIQYDCHNCIGNVCAD